MVYGSLQESGALIQTPNAIGLFYKENGGFQRTYVSFMVGEQSKLAIGSFKQPGGPPVDPSSRGLFLVHPQTGRPLFMETAT